ncbi:hypothetical protein A3C57_01375 [Candidatus Nomurabacteria bacterium RIFCSPHIGHO2_02_FULL_33_12]|nr:MAG: hypothetical protein A3C57_01375 [Candidatus Nomurabacteria bacterium RIFCSPHIGHO2_02_FULL_33_12]
MNSSKRTISYIGLWALIMPWLGFNWETKTVLFSLTGIVLLIVGNRQYHNEKKRQKVNLAQLITEEKIEEENFIIPELTIKRKIEMPSRSKRIIVKTQNTPIEVDSLSDFS